MMNTIEGTKDATEDDAAAATAKIMTDMAVMMSFNPGERAMALAARLRRDIGKLALKAAEALASDDMDAKNRALDQISAADEMFTDFDLEEDTAWMVLKRRELGLPVGAAAAARFDEIVAKYPHMADLPTH